MPDTIEGYGHYGHRSPHTPPPPVYVLADHRLPYPNAAADAAAASARRGGTPAAAVLASGPAYPYAGAVARGYASPSGSGTASPPSPRQAYDSAWRGGASSPHVHVSPQTRRAAYGAPDGAAGPSVNYPAGYPHHSSPQHAAHHHSPGRAGGGVALPRQPLQATAAGGPPPAHNFGAMRRRRVVADAADPMATGRDTVSQQELDRSQLYLVGGTQYSDLQNSLVSARHIASKPCVCAYRRPPPQPQAEPEGPIRYDAYGNPIEDKLYYAVDGLMQCVACEAPMFDTSKYCPNCATKVFLTCPRPECGKKTRAPSPRCEHCYSQLPQEDVRGAVARREVKLRTLASQNAASMDGLSNASLSPKAADAAAAARGDAGADKDADNTSEHTTPAANDAAAAADGEDDDTPAAAAAADDDDVPGDIGENGELADVHSIDKANLTAGSPATKRNTATEGGNDVVDLDDLF